MEDVDVVKDPETGNLSFATAQKAPQTPHKDQGNELGDEAGEEDDLGEEEWSGFDELDGISLDSDSSKFLYYLDNKVHTVCIFHYC